MIIRPSPFLSHNHLIGFTQVLITGGVTWNDGVAVVDGALWTSRSSCSVLAAVSAGYLIDGIRRKCVGVVLCLLCSVNACCRTWRCSFKRGRKMAFFVRGRNRAITFDILWLVIIYVQCVQCWSRPGLGIEVLIKALRHLMLQFKLFIQITAVVLAPKIVEVVKSIINTRVGTNRHRISIQVQNIALVVDTLQLACDSGLAAPHGCSCGSCGTVGVEAGAALARCVLSLLSGRTCIRCSGCSLLCHKLRLFRCIGVVVEHLDCCLSSRLIGLGIQLMQFQC